MSLVTKKTLLCATKVTSVIMLEIAQRDKKKKLQSRWCHDINKKINTEMFCVIKHLLYRRANIYNMYNYKKVNVYVN